jgi:hypothetical protein
MQNPNCCVTGAHTTKRGEVKFEGVIKAQPIVSRGPAKIIAGDASIWNVAQMQVAFVHDAIIPATIVVRIMPKISPFKANARDVVRHLRCLRSPPRGCQNVTA